MLAARTGVKDRLRGNGSQTKKALLERWEKYEEMLSIMGQGRNSYSKTDTDATFMRMKKDHMRNGQICFIKPDNYNQKKTSKFRKQVGRIENMEYDPRRRLFYLCTEQEATSEAGDHRSTVRTVCVHRLVPV